MKYFPYENYKLKTNLTPDEIRNKLHSKIEQKKFRFHLFWNKDPSNPYEGFVNSSSFEINRIIGYQNSFRRLHQKKIITRQLEKIEHGWHGLDRLTQIKLSYFVKNNLVTLICG